MPLKTVTFEQRPGTKWESESCNATEEDSLWEGESQGPQVGTCLLWLKNREAHVRLELGERELVAENEDREILRGHEVTDFVG